MIDPDTFHCPKCGEWRWGTVDAKALDKVGYCKGCGFRWLRSEDFKYFKREGEVMPSEQPNDGGPAFPCEQYGDTGLTLRDYFATHALVGMSSDPATVDTISRDDIAAWCYDMADAMLKERE